MPARCLKSGMKTRMFCILSSTCEWKTCKKCRWRKLTDLETFSQVFLKRKTVLLLKAAQIWSTPLKLCRHLEMSATAAHFSIAATRVVTLGRRIISDTTSCETWNFSHFLNLMHLYEIEILLLQIWTENKKTSKKKYKKYET